MRGFALLALGGAMGLAAPASAEEIVVKMAGSAYAPEVIEARMGDTLRFVNDDTMSHNVFVPTAGYAIDLGKQDPAAEATLVLRQAGAFEVECVFHDFMTAKVEVTP